MSTHAYPPAPPLPTPAAGLQAPPGGGSNDFRGSSVASSVTHKRSYQACIPCRRRKVRCDLGSVEAPHSPPCVRCRRESKECFFSATRRRGPGELTGSGDEEGPSRKKVKEDPKRHVVGPPVLPTTLPIKPGHTRAQSVSTVSGEFVSRPRQRPSGRNSVSDGNGYFEGQPEPGDRNIDPALAGPPYDDPTQAATTSASRLLSTDVYNTPDALALLFEAVGRSAHISPVNNNTSTSVSSGAPRRSFDRKNSTASVTGGSPTVAESGNMRPPPPKSSTSSCDSHGVKFQDGSVSPRVNRNHINNLSIHSKKIRRLTGRELSPSRSRVLLADENEVPESILDPTLINSMDDSDEEENPMEIGAEAGPTTDPKGSPTSPTSMNPSSSSSKTKDDDPFKMYPPEAIQSSLRAWAKYRLVIAGWLTPKEALLLMTYFYSRMAPMSPIFTGYFQDPSTHEELVMTEPVLATTLLTLASRYCLLPGAGGLSRSYAIHDKLWRNLQSLFQRLMWGSEKGMRTMGTVLALVALTEWHCRGLHFPGEDDGEYAGLGVPGFSDDKNENEDDGNSSTANRYVVEGLGDSIGNLLEPAYRSDRMSWMLLGNSLALAYELGVFDENEEDENGVRPIGSVDNSHPSASKLVARPSTATVQRILVISVMHLASRLGWTSMIPRHISVTVLFRGKQRSPFLREQLQSGSNEPVDVDEPPSLTATPVQDLVLQSWVELTSLMKSASELLFPSRKVTKTVLRTGRYARLLEHFQPLLTAWRREFDNLTIEEPMRSIMRVEFEYLRLYVNSLALQAVVDRCTNANLNPNNLNGGAKKAKDVATPIDLNSNPTITPATFVAPPPVMASHPGYATLMQICAGDEEYIKEVVDASRCLLLTVIRKLLPGGWLKHAPVRTYLRIASAAMYLLKTFALGAREDDVKVSMKLMDQTVYALRAASCDDVHLALRFADLLEALTARIRTRFVRMNQSGKDTPNRLNHGEFADQPMADAAAAAAAAGVSNGANHDESDGMAHANIVYGNNIYSNEGNAGGSFPNGFNGTGGGSAGQFPTYANVFPTSFHAMGDTGNFSNLASMYGIGDHEMDGLFGGTGTGGDDWLTLPIEPLLGYGAGVSNGMMGPDVGGQDLLELLLAEEN